MQVAVKTHLIVTDIHSEYDINWCGKLKDAIPLFRCGAPVFVIRSAHHRVEANTWDIKKLEQLGKDLTTPKGRGAISKDQARIYLKEENNNEKLMCIITHRRVKTFAPMYDKIEWR